MKSLCRDAETKFILPFKKDVKGITGFQEECNRGAYCDKYCRIEFSFGVIRRAIRQRRTTVLLVCKKRKDVVKFEALLE